MSRLLYACRFEVPIENDDFIVIDEYQSWICHHYINRRKMSDFECNLRVDFEEAEIVENHILSSKLYESDNRKVFEILWKYPDDRDKSLRWNNIVRIGVFDKICSVEHQISIESLKYTVTPPDFIFGSPHVIRSLCSKTKVYIGDMLIQAKPIYLNNEEIDKFIEILCSEKRILPVVFLSPFTSGENNLLNPNHLAKRLAGLAAVIYTHELDVTRAVSDGIGRLLSCFNGAARIYWPSFVEGDNPYNHPLYLGSTIERKGPKHISSLIQKAIFEVTAFRFVHDPRISNIILEHEANDRQRRLEVQKTSSGYDWESFAMELDSELKNATQKLSELQAENNNLKENQKVLFANSDYFVSKSSEEVEEELIVESVIDAVNAARNIGNNLNILDNVNDSAGSCPFQRPIEIYHVLLDLNEVVNTWKEQREKKGNGGDIIQYLREMGWGKRCSMHISEKTKGKFRNHYEFEYEGEKKLFEPHITLGAGDPNSCASIHFIFDPDREKIIVAHVGKHLPNTKT